MGRVWYIYRSMKWLDIYGFHVGISYIYTSLMDPMGNGVIFLFEALIQQSSFFQGYMYTPWKIEGF